MLVEQSHLPVELIPAIVFLVSAGLSFSIGTAWGTFGIFIPIVVFICQAAPSEIMTVTLAATPCGFRLRRSLLPDFRYDNPVIVGAGCNHMQHVATQIPYATVVAISCFISYIVAGVTGGSAPLTLLTGVGMLYPAFVLHRRAKRRARKKNDLRSILRQQVSCYHLPIGNALLKKHDRHFRRDPHRRCKSRRA